MYKESDKTLKKGVRFY